MQEKTKGLKKKPDYIKRIDELKEEMINDLYGLVRRRSVQSEPRPGAPFGEGVAEAFRYMTALAEREGFSTEDINGYGGHIDYGENADAGTMGILCHLDVVPEGDGWDHHPFEAEIIDGVMYGRGTLDDKGPTISAFYAMKALHDCGYEPKKRIRMILGLDEETGSNGMSYYKEHCEMPDFAIVPDAEFPLVHGEMGILVFDLARRFGKKEKGGISLKRLSGGRAFNMVPDSASALINCESGYDEIKRAVDDFCAHSHYSFKTVRRGKSLEIICEGKAAHGAVPWKGLNAISVMMSFLGTLCFNCEAVNEFTAFYNDHIGFRLHGEKIGCELEDEVSGKLIFNVGIADINEEKASITVNVRCPVSLTDQDVYKGMMPVLDKYDIGIVKHEYKPSLYYSLDNPVVKQLLEIYRERTGDYETEPLVIGGGTYAREMENAIAYGALYPGDPDIMHQKNECVNLERVVQTAKIYAEALYRLAVNPETNDSKKADHDAETENSI